MINAARSLSNALGLLGVLALLPAFVAFQAGNEPAGVFMATAAFCIFLAGPLRFATEGHLKQLNRTQSIFGLTLLWLVLPLAATPSVAISSGLPPLAAWLEAVSAFTATGITALKRAPASLYVWLALLQWMGGLLTLVSTLVILAPAGLGGLPDRTARGGSSLDVVDTVAVLKETLPLYAAGTVLLLVILLMGGHTLYVSFTLATAVASSGAHLPPEAQLALDLERTTKWLVLPFLFWSATSVRWHRSLATRRLTAAPDQSDSLVLIAYGLVLGVVFAALLFGAGGMDTATAMRDGLFSAASLIATSGIGPSEGTYEFLPPGLIIVVALLGGGAFSVAGGLKIMRLRAMMLRTRGDLLRLVYPNLVQPASLEEGGVGSAMRGVWVGATTLFALYALTVIALAPGLPSLDAALTAAAAVVSNTGPLYDAAGGGWPVLASLPVPSVLFAGFAMVAGRLEIIGMLVFFYLFIWRT